MLRKVIIDCDPGIDDAVALCLGLFEPRLEVVAVTAVEGNARADQVSRNVQTIVNQLDPPRLPRVGTASPNDLRLRSIVARFMVTMGSAIPDWRRPNCITSTFPKS